MVKYYIKITDEKPLDEDSALWFELESDGETGKADFFVLDRNEYTALVTKFNTIESKFEEDYVLPIVNDKINESISTLDTNNSLRIVESRDDNAPYYDYGTLDSALGTIPTVDSELNSSSTNAIQNKAVASSLENKADKSTVTFLQSTLNSKAPSNHTHTGWTFIQFNDYCIGYYNSAIRIIVVRYYRKGYNFKQTSTIKLHSGLFKNYKPIIGGDVVLPMYLNDMGGYVDNGTGDMYIYSKITGSRDINTNAMWRY